MEGKNQLAVIVKDSNLEPTKAKFILEKFTEYFDMADEWAIKARSIVVTKDTQEAEMQMARTGRLFLKEKRVAVENARKDLKAQSLREGKAIDGIANVLKALIIPIEEHLDKQEHFVEIQETVRIEAARAVEEKRLEDERIAKEKADAEAFEKTRLENEKLKAEAAQREKKMAADRKKQDEILERERAKAEATRKSHDKKLAIERAKAADEQAEAEETARLEREKRDKELAKERAKAGALRRDLEEKARKDKEKERVKLEAERKEKDRLAELLKSQVECPKCHHKFQLKKGESK